MNHEAECNTQLKDVHGRLVLPVLQWVCNCQAIQIAYNRGRKDATKAIEECEKRDQKEG